LFVSGEWLALIEEIELTFVGELAEKLGAHTMDIEHRYMGYSFPTE
jgi:hypothetical protein